MHFSEKKPHIVFDARMIASGGIGTYITNLLPFLEKADFDWTWLIPAAYSEKFSRLNGEKKICSAHPYSLAEQLQLWRSIPVCDLFWSPHFNVPFLPVRATRWLVTIHDVNQIAFSSQLGAVERFFARKFFDQAISKASRVVTVSAFSKKELIKNTWAKEDKIEVIHHGVDHQLFSIRDEKVHSSLKERFNLKENFILFVGNRKEHKNLRRLIEAFALFCERFSDYELILVGFDRTSSRCIDLNELLHSYPKSVQDKVRYLGFLQEKDLAGLYQLARFLAFPSLYEGFGFPALEAMCARCPVLTSNAASLPEVCGDAAYMVGPEEMQEIFQGFCALADSSALREELKEKGEKRSHDFSWEISAKKHLQILQEILASNVRS